MKKIEALIKPFKIESVKLGLSEIGIEEMTIIEAREYRRQGGRPDVFRGKEFTLDFVPKIKLEVMVPDGKAESVIGIIRDVSQTGERGEGKIFVTAIDQSLPASARKEHEHVLAG